MKTDKIKNVVIGIMVLLLAATGFKAYNYRKVLIEKKNIIVQKDKKIAELDSKLLESVKLGYESLIRFSYLDAYRTYGIRHPFEVKSSEFQLILNKNSESTTAYIEFLEKLGYKDGKLTKIIAKEKSDFVEVSDKQSVLYDLMIKEDGKNKK